MLEQSYQAADEAKNDVMNLVAYRNIERDLPSRNVPSKIIAHLSPNWDAGINSWHHLIPSSTDNSLVLPHAKHFHRNHTQQTRPTFQSAYLTPVAILHHPRAHQWKNIPKLSTTNSTYAHRRIHHTWLTHIKVPHSDRIELTRCVNRRDIEEDWPTAQIADENFTPPPYVKIRKIISKYWQGPDLVQRYKVEFNPSIITQDRLDTLMDQNLEYTEGDPDSLAPMLVPSRPWMKTPINQTTIPTPHKTAYVSTGDRYSSLKR